MGFSQQEYWDGLSFPPPGDHVLLELSTITHQSWLALHSMAHIFIELHKPLPCKKVVIHEGARFCKSYEFREIGKSSTYIWTAFIN